MAIRRYANWSKMADFEAELQVIKNIGNGAQSIALCVLMDSKATLDFLWVNQRYPVISSWSK